MTMAQRSTSAAILFLALALGSPTPSLAQFGGISSSISSTVSSEVSRSISDAISHSVREVLGARQVIDREKVARLNGLALGAGADRMVTATADGTIRLWDLGQGRELRRLPAHAGATVAVAAAGQGDIVVSAGADGTVAVWSLASGEKLAAFAQAQPALAVAVTADGGLVAASYRDGAVRLWSIAERKLQRTLPPETGSIEALAFDAAGATVYLAGAAGVVSAWDVRSGNRRFGGNPGVGGISVLRTLADGQLAVGGSAGKLALLNGTDGAVVRVADAGGSPLRSLAASGDGRHVAAGSAEGKVRVVAVADGSIVQTWEGHEDAVTGLAFGKADRVLYTASLDGTARVIERDGGTELVKAVSSPDGWAVVSSNGDFDGTGDALLAVTWQAEDSTFGLLQFTESHYEPGLLAKAANKQEVATRSLVERERPIVSEKFAAPPIVKITDPDETMKTDSEEIEISVEAGDMGGGIREVRLYQNNRLIHTADFSTDKVETTAFAIDVELLMGRNEFRAVGYSNEMVESAASTLTVEFTGDRRESTLHLVTIGINQYRNPALNLNYGVPDSKGLRSFFESQPDKLFRSVQIHALLDQEATRDNIKSLIEALETGPEDVVVLYYAGHGETVGGDWYLVPTEVAYPEKEEEIRSKGIKSTELDAWVKTIKANKVVMFMDACKSGAALKAFRGFEERKALARLAHASGVHVVAAAAKDQFAAEVAKLGHGAFTYTLLDGLKGRADLSADSIITVRELTTFVEDQLPELSGKLAGYAQFPVIASRGNDFPIAVR